MPQKRFEDGCEWFLYQLVFLFLITISNLIFPIICCSFACRVFIFLIVFIGSYTALLNVLNNFLWNPENYKNWGISDEFLSQVLPTLSGLTQTLLFTVCPFIFKFVANKSGEATSYESGEQLAMIYFWYFYLVVRYLGQLVVQSFNKLTQPGGTYYNRKRKVSICGTSIMFLF